MKIYQIYLAANLVSVLFSKTLPIKKLVGEFEQIISSRLELSKAEILYKIVCAAEVIIVLLTLKFVGSPLALGLTAVAIFVFALIWVCIRFSFMVAVSNIRGKNDI